MMTKILIGAAVVIGIAGVLIRELCRYGEETNPWGIPVHEDCEICIGQFGDCKSCIEAIEFED